MISQNSSRNTHSECYSKFFCNIASIYCISLEFLIFLPLSQTKRIREQTSKLKKTSNKLQVKLLRSLKQLIINDYLNLCLSKRKIQNNHNRCCQVGFYLVSIRMTYLEMFRNIRVSEIWADFTFGGFQKEFINKFGQQLSMFIYLLFLLDQRNAND